MKKLIVTRKSSPEQRSEIESKVRDLERLIIKAARKKLREATKKPGSRWKYGR